MKRWIMHSSALSLVGALFALGCGQAPDGSKPPVIVTESKPAEPVNQEVAKDDTAPDTAGTKSIVLSVPGMS